MVRVEDVATWSSDLTLQKARAAIAFVGGVASQSDLAKRWALSRQRVHRLVRELDFPEPVGDVSGAPVWMVTEADRWRWHHTTVESRGGP